MKKILLAILIVAALLRFVGTKQGYNQYHADEGISYSAATSMIKNGNLDPLRYDYPALVPLINYIFFRSIFIPFSWVYYYVSHIPQIIDGVVHIPIAPLEIKRIFQVVILGERQRNALFWGRYVTALFSLGNVLLTYIIARKLFNKKIGLIAAFLLTFNFKNVINSHIGLPDVYNAFFVLLVFLISINIWKKPTIKNYLLGAVAVGLSFSVKYQVFAAIPFLLAHIYASTEGLKINFRKLFNPVMFLCFFVIILTILVINPYHVAHLSRTIEIVKGVSQKYGMGVKKINLYPFWYFYHIDYGPIESIVILVGILVSLKKYFKETLLFMSLLIPYGFVFFYYSNGGFYVRNFITITPILLIMASVVTWTSYKFFRVRLNSKILNFFLLLFLISAVYLPGRNAIINSYNYTKPWGYDVMRPWIQRNLPTNVIVAVHPFDSTNLGITNKRSEFEISGAYSFPEHRENGAEYAVMNLNWAGNPFYFWMSFGFDKLSAYWNKPVDTMRNTFHGIAAEELFRYQLYAVTKPWQAPDTHLIIAKLPVWPKLAMVNISEFKFDHDLEKWSLYGKEKSQSDDYQFDKVEGHSSAGSILFLPGGTEVPVTRITSNLIPVHEGHLYNVSGFLKTETNLGPRERDGFLRIEFYKDNPDLEKIGMNASVSARVYGTTDWVKKEITERAPHGVKFLTVSFQTYITTRTKIWLDDVVVRESKEIIDDMTSKQPYNIKEIDLNYLYPNSHGNL